MDIIRAIIEQRLILIVLVFLLFLMGIFLVVAGVKIRKKNKLSGWLCIGVGSLFAVGMLYVELYVLFFGVNW